MLPSKIQYTEFMSNVLTFHGAVARLSHNALVTHEEICSTSNLVIIEVRYTITSICEQQCSTL